MAFDVNYLMAVTDAIEGDLCMPDAAKEFREMIRDRESAELSFGTFQGESRFDLAIHRDTEMYQTIIRYLNDPVPRYSSFTLEGFFNNNEDIFTFYMYGEYRYRIYRANGFISKLMWDGATNRPYFMKNFLNDLHYCLVRHVSSAFRSGRHLGTQGTIVDDRPPFFQNM